MYDEDKLIDAIREKDERIKELERENRLLKSKDALRVVSGSTVYINTIPNHTHSITTTDTSSSGNHNHNVTLSDTSISASNYIKFSEVTTT